jgi:ubiquinone/menaquinone biosynthesis C-methylase UbiE
MDQQHRDSATPFAIWEVAGTTEHLGGVSASRRLLDLCHILPGQTVLDVGCGTGYTARYVARRYHARVLAADIRPRALEEASVSAVGAARRGARPVGATRQGARPVAAEVAGQITLLLADAQHLPCSDGLVDVVVAESVLVFCDAPQVAAELCRVLKPGGVCAINELTLLAPCQQELTYLLQGTLGIRSYQSQEWQSILATAGLVDVTGTVRMMSLWEQLSSHLQVDGFGGYMRAVRKGLADARISGAFMNRAMLKAAWRFAPFVGYGLYAGRKPR